MTEPEEAVIFESVAGFARIQSVRMSLNSCEFSYDQTPGNSLAVASDCDFGTGTSFLGIHRIAGNRLAGVLR